MASDSIEIVDADADWPAQFAVERDRVAQMLAGEPLLAIEHFGSTAIPGLAAKPIIDILVAVPSVVEARGRFPDLLRSDGYIFWADNPDTDRLFFVKGMPPFGEGRTHHLHVCERSGAMWDRLKFRDYLRAHPDEARRYADLKRALAEKCGEDREAYTRGKDRFIARIMDLAETI
ncbi:MAG: GrpB family protein [Pseudomonadota bacterium]